MKNDRDIPEHVRKQHVEWLRQVVGGRVDVGTYGESKWSISATNLSLSKCFACAKVAIWVRDSLVYPPQKTGPEANADLPPDVLADYEEAQSILTLSPRGAAAMLRLAIQKLCKDLGESGENLNSDIANLVTKGLNPVVQMSLDIVRVIGNESVHPGTIDLRDNRDTALRLFGLVNLIAEQMITAPNHVKALYGTLPPEKLAQIEKRDKK
jgi:hypothetical protein